MALIRSWPATLAVLVLVTANAQQNLPGTKALVLEGDPAVQMVEGIHSFLDRETVLSQERRQKRSVAPDRKAFGQIIGALDQRTPTSGLKIDSITVVSPEGSSARAARERMRDSAASTLCCSQPVAFRSCLPSPR